MKVIRYIKENPYDAAGLFVAVALVTCVAGALIKEKLEPKPEIPSTVAGLDLNWSRNMLAPAVR